MRVWKSTHFVELKTTCFKWKPCIKCIVVSHLQVSAWQKGFNNRQIFPFFCLFYTIMELPPLLIQRERERSGTNHKDLEQLEYEINMNYIIIMQNSNLTEVWVEIWYLHLKFHSRELKLYAKAGKLVDWMKLDLEWSFTSTLEFHS